MHLARYPRVRLGHFPTPLERAENLTRALGGPEIWIKRDDCTGLATGGNKTRKLEWLVADAIEGGADTLVTQGATQSNHVRQTAAAAARYGLACFALLEKRVTNMGEDYETTGNVLFDDILGCTYEFRPDGADMNAEGREYAERLRKAGRKPYFIPGGGSSEVGALGYANGARELVTQADDMGIRIDRIVHATGSAGTQGGLLAGLHTMGTPVPVSGISVRSKKDLQEANVHRLAASAAEMLGAGTPLPREMVEAHDGFVGAGYGQPTDACTDAIALLARTEGIFLDPVYSGKGMAGLIGLIDSGHIGAGERVVFLHTGGAAALPAYSHLFARQPSG